MAASSATAKIIVGLFGKDHSVGKTFKTAWEKADTFEKKMNIVGKSMQKVGRSMTTFATVPIVGGMVAATVAAADEEKEMALLAKALETNAGASKESIAATEDWITAQQNATGIADGELRPALAKLIAATKDAGKAQDILTQAMDISAATGKPLETVTAALQKAYLGNVGGLSRLGVATKDAEGKTLSFKDVMANAAQTYGGAAATAADTTAGKFAILRNRMADLTEDIGTVLIPLATQVVDFVGKWADKFRGLGDGTKKLILILAGIVAAVGPVLMVVGQMLTMFGTLKTVITAVSGAMKLLNLAFLTSPLGLIVIGIAAVIAVFILLWTKCEWFRNFWLGLWERIKTVASVVWDYVKEKALAFWDWAGPTITAAAQAIWSAIKTAFDAVVAVFEWAWPHVQAIVQTHIDAIVAVVKTIISIVQWLRTNVWDPIVAIIDEVWPIIRDAVQGHIDAVKRIIEGIKSVVKFVRDRFNDIKDAASEIWDRIRKAIDEKIEAIKTIVRGISAIVGFVRDAFSKARDTVVEWKDKIVDAAGAIWTGVKTAAEKQWDLIVGIVGGAWDSIAGFINKIINGINWVIRNVPGLKGNVGEIPTLNTGGGRYGGGGSFDRSSPTPTVSTPRIMDNEGMGGPEAQGSDAGKGGGGGALGTIGGWLGDIWDKFDIWGHLPSPVTGLLAGTSKVMLGWAKDAIVGLLKKFASGGDRQKIVDFAMSMLGVPYLWGGTSPAGFDCSGLIYWAYQQAGVKDFPRIPTYGGRQISSGQMQPADVLFYYPNAVQEGRTVPFGHFKMYAGGGRTVESTSGGVQVRPLDSGYAQVRSYLYDQGGWLPPGVSIAVNKTGRPEPIGSGNTLVINVDARGARDPAAIEAAAKRGAVMALAQARRMSRRGAIG